MLALGMSAFSSHDMYVWKNGNPSLVESVDSVTFKINSASGASSSASEDELLAMSALELSVKMGNGINLGNTYDACDLQSWAGVGYDDTADTYATKWGQPVTTKAMIAGYKAAGFDCLRIPVAWTNTMDWANGDYEISAEYLQRVKEVVDWALDAGLYVILNDHYDNAWQKQFATDKTTAYKIYDAIWQQVGEYFKEESYALIFEGANEELCANGLGLSDESDAYTLTNEINQHFVSFIRAQGGKNAKRFLLLPGYSTDIEKTTASSYSMPTDDSCNVSNGDVNKLLVSVHYYTPYKYADGKIENKWGGKKQIETMNEYFEKLNSAFVQKGYGVIVGEYSATKDYLGNKKVGTEEFIGNVLDLCDYYNYVPLLWDCNDYYVKSSAKIEDSGVAALFARGPISSAQAYLNMTARLSSAPDYIYDTDYTAGQTSTAVAYLGYASEDWNVNSAANGDTWDPDMQADGMTLTTAIVTGAGDYTVELDASKISVDTDNKVYNGSSSGVTVMYLAITNGCTLLSGKTVTINSVSVDGTTYALSSSNAAEATVSGSGNLQVILVNPWAGTGIDKSGDFKSALNSFQKLAINFTVK